MRSLPFAPHVVSATDLLQITETVMPPNWAWQIQRFTVDNRCFLTTGTLQFVERLCHAYPRMRFPLTLRVGAVTAALTPLFVTLEAVRETQQLVTVSWVLRGGVTDTWTGTVQSVTLQARAALNGTDLLTVELATQEA